MAAVHTLASLLGRDKGVTESVQSERGTEGECSHLSLEK